MTKAVKCVFLDRDGVLNEELGYQISHFDEFKIRKEVPQALQQFKSAGYLLVVVTNQSGIAKGTYNEGFVRKCYEAIQAACNYVIDDLYFAPGYDKISKTLSRKPRGLMFEKAIAKHGIDTSKSWMIGDRESDMIPSKKLGINTIHLTEGEKSDFADYKVHSLLEAAQLIINAG
ncbi:D-glycero-alpha-D-manno-heptose-1,7-bisphosphate 7-phosphatase [Roseivirga pacifica]|uniref:D-glycero-alpha-D-manno-heptose-1,7-bisphosphate 7-phosphatase n=1 Tax=Roseivirga pacifica TaxID=1267423 RepID=UPI003BAF409A